MSSANLAARARLACNTCRKQKRKCSRDLPACLLCQKNGRPCEYATEAYGVAADERSQDYGELSGETLNEFPKLFFLDSYVFKHRHGSVAEPACALPRGFSDMNMDEAWLQHVVETYFESFHIHFPFVSKIRLHHETVSLEPDSRPADLVLLLSAMQLLYPNQGDISVSKELYTKVKSLASILEDRGHITIHLLQSYILLALYELCNAVHPAAYLTIGHCARMGYAIGIHDRRHATQMLAPSMSWTAIEEQRRVWWAVLVLDRYVNIGIAGRPFSCEDPRANDLLPQDEEGWENGEQTVSPSLAVSVNATILAPPYARTCQATDLLSRVLRHINKNPAGSEMAYYYRDAKQLNQILLTFNAAIGDEIRVSGGYSNPQSQQALHSAAGICYSAQIALYDMHTCADTDMPEGVGIPEQLEIQRLALSGIVTVCQQVHAFSQSIRAMLEQVDCGATSPFVADCLYAAARSYVWYWMENRKDEFAGPLRDIAETLRLVGRRWGVANEYISILEGEGLQQVPGWNTSVT